MSATLEFLQMLFVRSHSPVFICSLANERSQTYRLRPRSIVTRDCERVVEFIEKWDQPERALYFCVNTLRPDCLRRAKENIDELVCLYADLDFKHIEAERKDIEAVLRALPCRPNVVVFSGHGLHAYWLLDQVLPATPENVARIEALLKRLAHVLVGDPAVAEISRLLRLPGSHNSKNGEWTLVRSYERRAGRYPLARLEQWLRRAPVMLPRREVAARAQNRSASADPFTTLGEEQVVHAPIDVEQRLAEMAHHGPGETSIHNTQVSVTAALLRRGWPIDDVIARVLEATMIAVGPGAFLGLEDHRARAATHVPLMAGQASAASL
jgi:hypothetical protein